MPVGKLNYQKSYLALMGIKKSSQRRPEKPRAHETDDIDYHFLTKAQFESGIASNAFYEVTIYQDHYYGIMKKDVIENGLVIVDPNGANTLVEQANDIYVVYIEASEALRMTRMKQRGDDQSLIEKKNTRG